MRIPRLGFRRTVEFNVTPLIDVVFLLIVFFLVSSHLAKQETQVELELPRATSGRDPGESDTKRITVNLFSDGTLLLGSAPIDPSEIERRLQYERRQTSDELEVRIRADRQVVYQHVEPVLLACARARIWNVSFAVYDERR